MVARFTALALAALLLTTSAASAQFFQFQQQRHESPYRYGNPVPEGDLGDELEEGAVPEPELLDENGEEYDNPYADLTDQIEIEEQNEILAEEADAGAAPDTTVAPAPENTRRR